MQNKIRIDKCLELEELRGKNSGITYEERYRNMLKKKICGIRKTTKKAKNKATQNKAN